jgi:3-phenylpropionate/trans-cinnamate dioxygenase ferredoxin reductase subunit
MDRIVIVGAGQAGCQLAATLRAEGFEGALTLVGEEEDAPYQRPPLSKAYLLGDLDRERLHLRPRRFYDEQGIDLRLSARVEAISTDERSLTLDGEALGWDALALCTGAEASHLPPSCTAGLGGVHVLRSRADADALGPEIVKGRRLLVVGGGYIGLEAAAVAVRRGMHVTLVEMRHRILNRVAARETSDWFRALHRSHGVEVLEGVGLDTLLGEGRASAARLTDGREIPVDVVLAGVGARPATRLAEAAGIDCEDGIVVDAQGRTSAEGVWAAGDCASLPSGEGRMRLESVQNAIDGAEAVARAMLGSEEPYMPQPWFWSDQYDVKLQIAGLSAGHDRVAVRGAGAGRSHWYYDGARLVAVDAMNAPRDYMVGKRLIEAGRSPAPGAVEEAADLKALLA